MALAMYGTSSVDKTTTGTLPSVVMKIPYSFVNLSTWIYR